MGTDTISCRLLALWQWWLAGDLLGRCCLVHHRIDLLNASKAVGAPLILLQL